jgi:hypothetical protein
VGENIVPGCAAQLDFDLPNPDFTGGGDPSFASRKILAANGREQAWLWRVFVRRVTRLIYRRQSTKKGGRKFPFAFRV